MIEDEAKFCSKCGSENGTCPNSANQVNSSGPYVGAYKKKSQSVAVALSFFLPGLGHLYVGKILVGILLMVSCTVVFGAISFSVLLTPMSPDSVPLLMIIGFLAAIVISLTLWIYGMYSAYNDALEYNRQLIKNGQPPW